VIEKIMDSGSRDKPKVELNGACDIAIDWLERALANRQCSATPEQLAPWSPESFGKQLADIYQDLLDLPVGPLASMDPSAILDPYLRPDGFHFLKSAPKPAVPPMAFRAVIFDIYGTLLVAPGGGVKVDLDADEMLRGVISDFGFTAPDSPSTAICEVVRKHHLAAMAEGNPYPEVDLRESWREALGLHEATPTHDLVVAIESIWHPAHLMPGAASAIQQLAAAGLGLGILSNAQCNTRHAFGDLWSLFAPGLIVLSYQHGIAKPSASLFERVAHNLARRGIQTSETLLIGNDPLHDVIPAAAHGFKTAWFVGHPDSFRPGDCSPDYTLRNWSEIAAIVFRPEPSC
jgi:FMN phosphatase YigB (HAD superfamily)